MLCVTRGQFSKSEIRSLITQNIVLPVTAYGVLPGTATWGSLGSLVEMQTLGLHPRLTQSESALLGDPQVLPRHIQV